jgi:hypothetical protein
MGLMRRTNGPSVGRSGQDGNAKGRRLSKRTQEAITKVQGKPLGREMLEWASIRLMQAAQYYWPLTADGQPKMAQRQAVDRAGRPIVDEKGEPVMQSVEYVVRIHNAAGDHKTRLSGAPGLSVTWSIWFAAGAWRLSNCELRSRQARGDRLKGDFSN